MSSLPNMSPDELLSSSVPTLTEFNPNHVPWQLKVLIDIRTRFDYSLGVHEILLSGSVGSAKSILLAHLAVTHCLMYPGAVCMIGRRSMPQLRDTLLQMIIDHLGLDCKYHFNQTRGEIIFENGSKIFCHTWADKKYKKIRSYALSMAIIEELTENDDPEFFKEIRMRLDRLPHVPEKILVCATNPDSPSHWAYDYFIDGAKKYATRHVYYSVTSDNPFLSKEYVEGMKNTLSEREVQRMIYGQWIEIITDVVYYSFDEGLSCTLDEYVVNEDFPVFISYDFNIGIGKPMSVVLYQYIYGKFYVFSEVVIHGTRTQDTLDELAARGFLDHNTHYIIHGDASGSSRTTNYNRTDYEVIDEFLSNFQNARGNYISFEVDVPSSNPPLRKRHLIMNGLLKNSNGKTSIHIVKSNCPVLVKGLRLVKLKEGSRYIEDDNNEWQHVTTALAYGCVTDLENSGLINRFHQGKFV